MFEYIIIFSGSIILSGVLFCIHGRGLKNRNSNRTYFDYPANNDINNNQYNNYYYHSDPPPYSE